MIQARAWPAKAMYILFAAALAISLFITAAPAQKVSADPGLSEWDRVPTPTTEDYVLAPNSTIIDFAIGDDGEVAYAIVDIAEVMNGSTHLLKSEDHAATWDDDIDEALVDELEDDNFTSWQLLRVACDAEDSDFLAVAVDADGASVHVYVSRDGGATFRDTDEVLDTVFFPSGMYVADLAVSPEDDGERDLAIVGQDDQGDGVIFRCQAVGDFTTDWDDARYDGWDDVPDYETTPNPVSDWVTWVEFAPSWKTDRTILVTTIEPGSSSDEAVYLQSGTWGTTEGWNGESVVSIDMVEIEDNLDLPMQFQYVDARCLAGLTLPLDYSGRNSNERYVWVWVNYYVAGDTRGTIYRVKNETVNPIGWQIEDEDVWLTNVDYLGYISEGKAIAGVGGDGEDDFTACCVGVDVYRNDGIANMDICCLDWDAACKPPTGRGAMAVFYVSDDPASSKAYAVAMNDQEDEGWLYLEGAVSVSFDDGDVWNQLSLIDTFIHYLSDVAVSPDCNKTMLVSINDVQGSCGCDSVWLHAENLPEAAEYSGKWLRTWCGQLTLSRRTSYEWGFLRLAPEETTGDTVYLVDYDADTVYWNEMETLACWEEGAATVDNIVDLAVKDNETIFALDYNGNVAMSDDYALGFHEPEDSKVSNGYTIAVWGDHILVGGDDGEVTYSDDGGETFTELDEDGVSTSGYVTVAFDSYFDQNNTVYAGLDNAGGYGGSDNGIYRWIIGEDDEWTDLRVEPLESQAGLDIALGTSLDDFVELNITGLVLDTAEGNPMTSAETGGVLYASYYGYWDGVWFTGVARYLTPAEDVVCKECGDWDYLIEGLTINLERFNATPDALKLCGCLTPDSSTKLFSIDHWGDYDMDEYEDGAVWTFEDCYSKGAPDLTSPADGETIAADPCECFNRPFTAMWDRMCDACSYDIQFALDEDFDELVSFYIPEEDVWVSELHIGGDGFAGDTPSFYVGGILVCEFTYYWRVRAADAETGQYIRSWWSDPRSIKIAPSIEAGKINLISPEAGATDVAVTDVGFSWDLYAEADAFDWVLSANADLSAPIATEDGLTATATAYTGTALDYDTPYYWQVTAYKEGTAISTSSVGTFRTMVEPPPPPEDEEVVTPFWVWVVIAIGAVLVIVVIVLIFRTRRV